jgi:hypothetical protein
MPDRKFGRRAGADTSTEASVREIDELEAIALLCRLIAAGDAGERLLEVLTRRAPPPGPSDDHASRLHRGERRRRRAQRSRIGCRASGD